MAWLYLIVAGLFEIGWPVGLKLSQTPGRLVSISIQNFPGNSVEFFPVEQLAQKF